MDTFLAIASKRDTRAYSDRPLPPETVHRILEAARVTGNARNRQEWRFHVLESPSARERAAEGVTRPSNLLACAVAVAVSLHGRAGPFDAGRAAQSMMLAAANDGIVSCPNAIKEHSVFESLLDLADDERVEVVLSFGYPAGDRDPEARSADEWLARADRKPLEHVVRRV